MTEIETTERASRDFGRRSVLKGAAWSLPVVAAAVATPVAAATTPSCPDCFLPATTLGIGLAPFTAQGVRLPFSGVNSGVVEVVLAAAIDATSCVGLFNPAYVIAGLNATLTTTDNIGVERTYNAVLAPTVGAGTFGSISALAGAFTFTNVYMPNQVVSIGSYPVRPTKISITPLITLQAQIGIPPVYIPVDCEPLLEWTLDAPFPVGTVIPALGGTINWTGNATPVR